MSNELPHSEALFARAQRVFADYHQLVPAEDSPGKGNMQRLPDEPWD